MADLTLDFAIIIDNGEKGYNTSEHIKMDLDCEDVFSITGFVIYGLNKMYDLSVSTRLETSADTSILTVTIEDELSDEKFGEIKDDILRMLQIALLMLVN